MAFSLRSFFGKGGSGDGTTAVTPPPVNSAPAPVASPFQPAAIAAPAFANSMLFKTAAPEAPPSAPLAASPFAPAPASTAGLTIGDLLPSIPPDVAKNPGLPSTHPVAIPDHVLESALRSGRAAIPLFELFRACPVMFLAAVGPHDPREVPLPPQKIAHLISGTTASAAPQNPFATLPPRAAPVATSPFGIVSAPREDESPASAAPLFSPSPFGLVAEPGAAAQDPATTVGASPFSFMAPADPPSAGSPFTTAQALTASSPFSFAPQSPPPAAADGNPPPLSSEASPFTAAAAPQPATSLPAFPAMFGGPVVQSMPGVGSTSEDSSFFTASPVAAAPPQASPTTSPFAPAPAISADAPAPAPATWGSIFPSQVPPTAAAAPLPGVGDTFFPVGQATGSPSEPSASPPANAFFAGFGVPPAAAAAPETPASPSEIAKPIESSLTPPASTFPAAPTKAFNPFERIQALARAAESSSSPAVDTFAKQPQPVAPNLFGGVELPPVTPDAAAPTPAAASMVASAANLDDQEIKLGLAASLKNCATDDLGTNAENIPSWVQFTLPYSALADKLSSGRVVVPLDAIVAGLDTPIQALFARARAGVQVELPANLVFHAVSEIAPAEAPTAPAAQPVFALGPPPSPVAPVPDSRWQEPETPLAPQRPFWSNSEATTPVEPTVSFGSPLPAEIKPIFTPFVREDDPALPPTLFAPPVRDEPVIIPANPLTGAPEFVTPAPVLPLQGSFNAVATPRGDNGTRRLLLTVLLGSPDATDAAAIVRLTRQLPGVAAAICVNNGRPIAESGDDSADAQRFLRDAPSKISGLTALASLTGIEDAETLHIQSGPVEATFCLQGPVIFAVLHDPRRREPALKEKITLLGRELAAILGESSAN